MRGPSFCDVTNVYINIAIQHLVGNWLKDKS